MTKTTYWEQNPVNLNNEAKRLPVLFLLDVSPSMNMNNRINQLNLALKGFIEDLRKDIQTKVAVEIALVTFSTKTEVFQDFLEVGKMRIPEISALKEGATLLGQSILFSLEVINTRRLKFKSKNIDFYAPYLVVITDGKPEWEDQKILSRAIKEVYKAGVSTNADNCILTFPIGVGNDVTVEYLQKLAEGYLDRPIIFDDATEFSGLFKVISKSITDSVKRAHSIDEQKKETKNAWHEKLINVRRK